MIGVFKVFLHTRTCLDRLVDACSNLAELISLCLTIFDLEVQVPEVDTSITRSHRTIDFELA